ncbi:SDR family NAD(P)-dependent oxidoreductase [Mesorhizobium sp. PL10]
MTNIEKKTLLITGAAGRIGQAIFRQFVANGLRVVAGEAGHTGFDRLQAELNRTGLAVWSRAGDLTDKDYCEELIDYSIRGTGRLDVLINNAGISQANIIETADWYWERTFDINLTSISTPAAKVIGHSCWDLCRVSSPATLLHQQSRGRFLSKCLGRDLTPDGMLVNGVCPNEVNTPVTWMGVELRGVIPDKAIAMFNHHLVVWQSRKTRRCYVLFVPRRPLHRWHGVRSRRHEAGLMRTSHG